jgi:hypothetical protein
LWSLSLSLSWCVWGGMNDYQQGKSKNASLKGITTTTKI